MTARAIFRSDRKGVRARIGLACMAAFAVLWLGLASDRS